MKYYIQFTGEKGNKTLVSYPTKKAAKEVCDKFTATGLKVEYVGNSKKLKAKQK